MKRLIIAAAAALTAAGGSALAAGGSTSSSLELAQHNPSEARSAVAAIEAQLAPAKRRQRTAEALVVGRADRPDRAERKHRHHGRRRKHRHHGPYYVSPNGSDSNPGTSAAPWKTVGHVNSATLPAGSTVYFKGGASFPGTLVGNAGGQAGRPITYSSYGSGDATIGEVWVGGGPGRSFSFLTFDHLKTNVIGGRGSDDTIENSDIGNDPTSAAINIVEGDRWHITGNRVHDTGDSGILTQSGEQDNGKGGASFVIEGNTIENIGGDRSISYGKHGIYLKVRNARIINNTITNCLGTDAAGISVRYGNSTITGNHISKCPEGIGFYQYDRLAGTSHWTDNVIVGTTEAGIYVSPSDVGGKTRESFVIERNTIGPRATGVYIDLSETTGTHVVQENKLL